MRSSVSRTVAVTAVLGAMVGPAQAAELRVGGAWEAGASAEFAADSRGGVAETGLGRELRLSFTPRGGLGLWSGAQTAPIELELELGPARAGLGRLEALSLVPSQPARGRADTASGGLAVGGALAWSGWTVGGSYVTGSAGTSAVDLWSGAVGYGPVVARFGYGQTTAVGGQERELWLFGTELATRPWLTLEGDLAITSGAEREPAAAGRVGIRLNF